MNIEITAEQVRLLDYLASRRLEGGLLDLVSMTPSPSGITLDLTPGAALQWAAQVKQDPCAFLLGCRDSELFATLRRAFLLAQKQILE